MSKQQRLIEAGRYWLQIDRQTKSSYDELEAAQTAGEIIKKRFPQIHVALYDRQSGLHSVLRNPAAA
jgi:hypothetical protein